MADVVYNVMHSPAASITVASTSKGVCWLRFGSGDLETCTLLRWSKKWLGTDQVTYDADSNRETITQLEAYFQGRLHEFSVPIDMHGTPFQLKVWNALRNIPYGETRSYKDIALAIGATKAVRAIGGANHHNPVSIIVPCHRVIGSNGALVGYGSGLHLKEYLLTLENVIGDQTPNAL